MPLLYEKDRSCSEVKQVFLVSAEDALSGLRVQVLLPVAAAIVLFSDFLRRLLEADFFQYKFT